MDKLVYLSPVPWESYTQRPHQTVRYFLSQGPDREVLWIDPYSTRLPRWSDFFRLGYDYSLPNETLHGLHVIRPGGWPVEPLPSGARVNQHLFWKKSFKRIDAFKLGSKSALLVGKPCALAASILNSFMFEQTYYDAMDDFPEFYNGISRKSMLRYERLVAENVESILVSSKYLFEKFSVYEGKVHLIHNACEPAALPRVSLRREKMVFGYIGSISDWFDWDLVINIAEAMPEAELCLVGPIHRPSGRKLPENIKLIAGCPLDEVGQHLKTFTVGLIPFKCNRLTRAVDPIKYYEYRSMGLPVLCTSFGEMLNHQKSDSGLFLCASTQDFLRSVDRVIAYEPTSEETQFFRHQNTWEERFSEAGLFS